WSRVAGGRRFGPALSRMAAGGPPGSAVTRRMWALCAVAALCGVGALGYQQPWRWERRIERLVDADRMADAIALAEARVRSHPQDGASRLVLARLYLAHGNANRAAAELSEVVRFGSTADRSRALRALARLSREQGDVAEERGTLHALIINNPRDRAAYLDLGRAEDLLNAEDATLFERGVREFPGDDELEAHLVRAYKRS